MGFVLSERSETNLQGVHPDLVRVVRDCAANGVMAFEFTVIDGLRTVAEERVNVASGASQTMKSRHLDGHAVDLMVTMNGQPNWTWPVYEALAGQMKASGVRCKVPLTWGGSWLSLRDGGHFELPWSEYPSTLAQPVTTSA